jgi:hypothetical protein
MKGILTNLAKVSDNKVVINGAAACTAPQGVVAGRRQFLNCPKTRDSEHFRRSCRLVCKSWKSLLDRYSHRLFITSDFHTPFPFCQRIQLTPDYIQWARCNQHGIVLVVDGFIQLSRTKGEQTRLLFRRLWIR